MSRAALLAAGLGLAVAACSAPALPSELARAYDREQAGDVDGALAAYRAAAVATCDVAAPSRKEREDCGRALVGEAELLERDGRTEPAIAAYAAIAERTGGDPPPSALGLFRAGRLAYDQDHAEQAAGYLWRVVVEYPDEAFAADAIEFIVARTRGHDAKALWARLSGLYPQVADTQVADNLMWWLADVSEHELADATTARALYDRLPTEHPTSGLRDDARWRAAALSRSHGDFEGAVRRLRGLLATREVAIGAGSYFSVWLDDAQLTLGRVLRDDLHRLDDAAAAFARLPEDYPRSILVDDALDELATTLEAKGDPAGVCRAAARLLAHDAESKFAPRARERRAQHACPEARR